MWRIHSLAMIISLSARQAEASEAPCNGERATIDQSNNDKEGYP
jgi:hypothetical protein